MYVWLASNKTTTTIVAVAKVAHTCCAGAAAISIAEASDSNRSIISIKILFLISPNYVNYLRQAANATTSTTRPKFNKLKQPKFFVPRMLICQLSNCCIVCQDTIYIFKRKS